ncbi:zinc D-Ala-D-Ala carboxypeptidase [Enterococcus sp. AZ194]|uniref:M15 family metallopeptidase n=1 Tax=Enterococcus sp. AZ194 TaxID=2774629 RepID=UPI003F24B92D
MIPSGKTITGILAVGILLFVTFLSLTGGFAEKKTTATSETKEEQTKVATTDTENPKRDLPNVSVKDWSLVLVGPENKLTNEVNENNLEALTDGHQVDKRIVTSFEALEEAAQKAKHPLVVISAFRSVAYQQTVFDRNVTSEMSKEGISEEEAIAETKKTVTEPGYSEHHTGLAVDVVDESWYNNYPDEVLEEGFGKEAGAKWLAENAPKYGFIIRYPKGKEAITKIDYEPWHLRYVGEESAKYITEHHLTLEEYLKLF